jgi:hypothetical protein
MNAYIDDCFSKKTSADINLLKAFYGALMKNLSIAEYKRNVMNLAEAISENICKYVYPEINAPKYGINKFSVLIYECFMNNYERSFTKVEIEKFNTSMASILTDIVRYFIIYNDIKNPNEHLDDFGTMLDNVCDMFVYQKMPKTTVEANSRNLRLAFYELSRNIAYSKICYEYLYAYLTKNYNIPIKYKKITNAIARAISGMSASFYTDIIAYINLKIGTIDPQIIQSDQIQIKLITTIIVDFMRVAWFTRNVTIDKHKIDFHRLL